MTIYYYPGSYFYIVYVTIDLPIIYSCQPIHVHYNTYEHITRILLHEYIQIG